jgi:hypothetical protein
MAALPGRHAATVSPAALGREGNMNRRNRKVVWNGIEYGKLKDAARANHVSEVQMWRRLKQGYTCDADMLPGMQSQIGRIRAKPCIWNGIEYDTVTAAARANNKTIAQMSVWINKGYMSDGDRLAGRKPGGRPRKHVRGS